MLYNAAMTEKQAKAIKLIAEKGMSKRQAMLQAGYAPSVANTPGKLTSSKTVQQQLQKALRKHNLTVERIVAPIDAAISATKYAVDKQTGDVYDTGIADHSVRLKASAMASKLVGLDDLQSNPNPGNNNLPNDTSIIKALKSSDSVELYQATFSKTKDDSIQVSKQ
jgi:hypothetical protein